MPPESDTQDVQKARTFFQYGNEAALKSNLDYAIDMYKQACKLSPDSLIFRQALRGVQRRKFNNEPSKVGRLAGARNQPIRMRAGRRVPKEHYAQCLEICEDAFTNNPWDVSTAREAAEAAEMLSYFPLAQWYLESVQSEIAKDAEFFRHIGHVHELNEAWAKAIAAWEQVKKIDPYDEDANRKINGLSASATIKRAKLEDQLDDTEEARHVGRGCGGEARSVEAGEADARGAAPKGDQGRPDAGLAVPGMGRHLPQAEPVRDRREDPGEGDQGRTEGRDALAGVRRGPDDAAPPGDRRASEAGERRTRRRHVQGEARPAHEAAAGLRGQGTAPADRPEPGGLRTSTTSSA